MQFIRNMINNTGIVGELFGFLWRNKKWWLIPMVAVLVAFGLLMIFATSSGLGPLIYTLF
ncbi:MAG: DUF5989 family protein [Chloroflexota bacterium]